MYIYIYIKPTRSQVFVAPELDAIEQVPPGEDPKISPGSRDGETRQGCFH